MPEQPSRAVVAAGVLSMVMFSANFAASGHGLRAGLSVVDLVLLRYAVVGPFFLLLLWRIGLGGLSLRRAAALALLAGAPYYLLTAGALEFAPATHAAILNPGGTMLAAPLLGWLVLRERPEIGGRVGLPILAAGLLMIGGTSLVEDGGDRAWIGDLVLLWSGANWALYGVLMRRWGVSGLRAAAIVGAFALAWAPLHLLAFGAERIAAAPWESAAQGLYQGVVAGGVAVVLYSRAVVLLGPARGALLPPIVPAFGVFWAWVLLGETITPLQVAGMVTVTGGMLCGALWRGSPAAGGRATDETLLRRP